MSGDLEKIAPAPAHGGAHTAAAGALGQGPLAGRGDVESGFTARQLARLDEALTLASHETGLTFSVYVGDLAEPSRGAAEGLFDQLADSVENAVLIAVSPTQRVLQIVTGADSAARLPNRACALAALGMRASFSSGDLTGGIVSGLRMLADSAGRR